MNGESDGIPNEVVFDVQNPANEELVKRWLFDTDFRAGMLNAESPREYAAGALEGGVEISDVTEEWIKGVVREFGVDDLVTELKFVAF